jgi:hypothetical protein
MRGSLHYAVHDETMNSFGRDDGVEVGEEGIPQGLKSVLLIVRDAKPEGLGLLRYNCKDKGEMRGLSVTETKRRLWPRWPIFNGVACRGRWGRRETGSGCVV